MIILDSRETELIMRIQTEPFSKVEGKDFRIERLPAGDIAIQKDGEKYPVLGFERKTHKDFTGTWASAEGRAMDYDAGKADRLSSQLTDTYKSFEHSGLIIEMANKDDKHGISLLSERAERYFDNINFGMWVKKVMCIEETIELIIYYHDKVQSGWRPSRTKHVNVRDKSLSDIANACSSLNIGIKADRGALLEQHCGSLPALIDEIRLNPEGLRKIEGIGPVTVRKLIDKFGYPKEEGEGDDAQ